MRLSRPAVTLIILIVIVAALGSLVYPVVPVSLVGTETIHNTSIYIESYSFTLLRTSVATIQVPYSTATAWFYTAYPLCDPAFLACPGPPVAVVTTFSGDSVWYYQVATTTHWSVTYTTEYSALTAHTTIENVPIYSAQGLTVAQFIQLVIAIITVGLLGLLITNKLTRLLRNGEDRSVNNICNKCGAEYLSPNSAYCFKCGASRDR